jgi:hypothetical protein
MPAPLYWFSIHGRHHVGGIFESDVRPCYNAAWSIFAVFFRNGILPRFRSTLLFSWCCGIGCCKRCMRLKIWRLFLRNYPDGGAGKWWITLLRMIGQLRLATAMRRCAYD